LRAPEPAVPPCAAERPPPAAPPDPIHAPLSGIPGVGPRALERLARLGLRTLQDALLHLPLRYEDRTRIRPIGDLRAGTSALVEGTVELTRVRPGRRASLASLITDGTGELTIRLFHFNRAQQTQLSAGARVRCFGEVRAGPGGIEMVHPEYRVVDAREPPPVEPSLSPVYPTTEGLGQATLRRVTDAALDRLDGIGDLDLLPETLLRRLDLPPLADALRQVHRPPPSVSAEALASGRHPALRRLAYEELLAQHLSLRALRARVQALPAPPLVASGALARDLVAALPFVLTAAQRRVAEEVGRDLAEPRPMLRLVQGDVGSGKTVIAALAAAQAVEAGHQVAVMAPTEILAEQHLRTLGRWLGPLGVEVAWLSGRQGTREREDTLAAIADHRTQVAVGTHALFQDEVRFARLGLVVVDEQHRFGVHQRLALREKGGQDGRRPHQLIMTATPIPRTLAMTAYADLDVSVLDELPPGREPVDTLVIPDTRREEVVVRIARACREGRQAYWVCTLIEESEALEAQAAAETAARLEASLPGVRIGLIHGRLRPAEKDAAMAAFQAGETGLLVATTVIEVGVDVPRASLMIIENAERLGLAQLHQLRGRVGRGSAKSACVLLYHPPLSETSRRRLAVIRSHRDGFAIAEEDLRLRGPGDVLGTRQTGLLQLRVADPSRDQGLLGAVAAGAREIGSRYPERVPALLRRWIGDRVDYGHV
jgi:ATP-dependent DNA helicase RecG